LSAKVEIDLQTAHKELILL